MVERIIVAVSLSVPGPQRMEDLGRRFDEAGLVDVQLKRGYSGIGAKGKRPN